MEKIEIGFKFSEQYKDIFGRPRWRDFEVIGSRYGKEEGFSSWEWKEREDILKLARYLQIMSLPSEDNPNKQLSYFWEREKELIRDFEKNSKLLPEHRTLKIL